jgi:hypothetical protein
MNAQNFTEKSATFKGEFFNIRGFLNSGVHYASKKQFNKSGNIVKVTWICENPDEDIHDMINPEQLELWGIDIIGMVN